MSTAGEAGRRRDGATSSTPRSSKARKRPVFALGSSNSDMRTTLAAQASGDAQNEHDRAQRSGASASARSTSRDSTITLRVLTTNGSARIRSITSSKCRTSAARMWTKASASPVICTRPPPRDTAPLRSRSPPARCARRRTARRRPRWSSPWRPGPPGREARDRARRPQPVHPPLDRGRGQPDLLADQGVAGPRVVDQLGDDPCVDVIHDARPQCPPLGQTLPGSGHKTRLGVPLSPSLNR